MSKMLGFAFFIGMSLLSLQAWGEGYEAPSIDLSEPKPIYHFNEGDSGRSPASLGEGVQEELVVRFREEKIFEGYESEYWPDQESIWEFKTEYLLKALSRIFQSDEFYPFFSEFPTLRVGISRILVGTGQVHLWIETEGGSRSARFEVLNQALERLKTLLSGQESIETVRKPAMVKAI